MPGRYHLVYDITDERVPHPAYLVVATMLLLTGVILLVYRGRRQRRKGVGPWLIAAALLFAAFTSIGPWWDVWHLKRQMREQALAVEGVIAQHRIDLVRYTSDRPDPRQVRTREQFQVDSVRFHFIREADIAGFHNADEPPVDLREGLLVRIRYVPDEDTTAWPRILRLEIAGP